ncbi:MAG: carboxypeptidase-like regulatory domain-containing protein [Paludibacteraceae bacterium]|nr:carboxypeptidase-like regulatory domain-containing protein [Paludibacteraceae bacterium]
MLLLLSCLMISCLIMDASPVYRGRVTDEQGGAIPYATVYLKDNPMEGTATNADGVFELESEASPFSVVIISFIGFEKQEKTLGDFVLDKSLSASSQAIHPEQQDAHLVGSKPLVTVRLKEQPIALDEMIVAARQSRKPSKKKTISQQLYKVYNRMQYDMPEVVMAYTIVSDVRAVSKEKPLTMEQMVARMVHIPGAGREGRDSVQMQGMQCKRYFLPVLRDRADELLAEEGLDKNARKMMTEMDSGVVVHKGLWAGGNVRYNFEQEMNDWKHWTIHPQNDKEMVLTYESSRNYLGIFKFRLQRHYIVDSKIFRILRTNEDFFVEINIPFGYKLKPEELKILNLLNISEVGVEKFRVKNGTTHYTLSTLYQTVEHRTASGKVETVVCVKEKNLKGVMQMNGTQHNTIPMECAATQRVTKVEVGAQPLTRSQITRRVPREIVPIY